MNIADNILKEQLKNVYFLSGGGYGGKTTMAKLIEQRHGLLRYRQGDHDEEHEKISALPYQPAMCLDRSKDWHGFFSQPPEQYAQWMLDRQMEDEAFVIMDLVRLSQNRCVIADVGLCPETLHRISDPSRVVLLFAPEAMTRKHYFDREDKRELQQFILSFPDGQALLENVLNALHYRVNENQQSYLSSGFLCIQRTDHDTIQGTLSRLERHFGLS